MTVFTLRFEETLALIGIDRAEARNAVPLAGWRELAVICETISNRAPDAVLLRSEAADIFSAGADIGEFPSLRDEPAQRVAFREAMAAGIGALAALPMPVIAAVDGGCFGAGVALMLGCDICVAGREARFATTPARLGLSYPGSDVARLIDRVGKGFASLMLFTGEAIPDYRDIRFDHWLPAFNVRLDTGNGVVIRGAVSKGISRPDLQLFSAGGVLGFSGRVDDGPLLAISTGNRNLLPTESWNYDLSVEWYFDRVGSLTGAIFAKDIEGIVTTGTGVVNYTTPSGVSQDVIITGPANDLGGTLKGFELAYQQTYDFLPGVLSGLGSQLTYTYVDGGDFRNPNLSSIGSPSVASGSAPLNGGPFTFSQPLAGISEHTINATLFYEKGPLAMRAAYNWRSEFLITPRDDIFPFSPIWQEAGGQLDASIFYDVTKFMKIGVQGVNLLDEITETSQVVDYDGTRITRSAFRNDRRYTLIARFKF